MHITVKYAQTLDGRLATRQRGSQWLTGPQSRLVAHQLRAEHDAVLVGIGTVLADDPQLTVRLAPGKDPVRIVLDSMLRLPLSAKILRDDPSRTIVATSRHAASDRAEAISSTGSMVLRLGVVGNASQLDVAELLGWMEGQELRSVLVEGGASVITTFFRRRLVDRISVFIAPKIIGTGIDAIGELAIERMSDAITLQERSVQKLGADVLVSGRPLWPE